MAVFVFDDVEPEETESLSFHLRSPDTSAVRIMQGRDQQRIFIVDNDGEHQMEHSSMYWLHSNV